MSAGEIQDFAMSVCECGLSSPTDEHQVNWQSESWYRMMGNEVRKKKVNTR